MHADVTGADQVTREDLSGADAAPAGGASSPGPA